MQKTCFHFETDKVNRTDWDELLTQFTDATLYQTWSYGSVTKTASRISHAVLKSGSEILACCQVTIRHFPMFNFGLADIKWGPLYRKKTRHTDLDILGRLIHDLKQEYAVRRRLLLRIRPGETGVRKEAMRRVLADEGFQHVDSIAPYRTLYLDLAPSLEDLRKNLLQKWRNCLNKAEKNGLKIIEGTQNELYKIFLLLAQQMTLRKNFEPGVDLRLYSLIQEDLPGPLKMRIAVCEFQNEPVCVAIYSVIGDTGIYLLGATGDEGLKLKGAYLLQWHMIQRMKESGALYYDLGGIDPRQNPGVYDFKLGVAGKTAYEEELMGEFHGCFTIEAKIMNVILKAVKFLRRMRKR